MQAITTSAIVLAGGHSTRLGRDKASEPLLGVPLLQRVIDRLAGVVGEIVVVRAAGQALPALHSPARLLVAADDFASLGPLSGLFTGLRTASLDAAFACACDMPLLQPALVAELVRLLEDYDAVVPVGAGFAQPLCAVYSRRCAVHIRPHLDARELRMTAFLDAVRVRYVAEAEWRPFDPEGLSFLNLNTEAGLRQAEDLLRRELAAPGPTG
jgi:molybdopterin-guanine dinucleotide biosynthesis protein A